jgi:hypothetical protein
VTRVIVVTLPAGILRDVLSGTAEDCMQNKNQSLVLHTKPTSAPTQAAEAGWDPFEVWRTRVLQPRLAEARAEKAPTPPAVVPLPRR